MTSKAKRALITWFENCGLKTIYYFHTDHFEPTALDNRSVVDRDIIKQFISETSKYEHSKRMTLFYRPTFTVKMKKDLKEHEKYHVGKNDSVVFVEDEITKESKEILRILKEKTDHEFQLHIHHENFTDSDEVSEDIKSFIKAESTTELDEQRFEDYILLSKKFMSEALGRSFNKWFFIHGKWGLNGSDRRVCRIENELGILARNGCLGDFTFPAGRRHCNPYIKRPFVTKPIRILKCYDYHSSDSKIIGIKTRVMQEYDSELYELYPGRYPFFIWNSELKHPASSLDYFSKKVLGSITNTDIFLRMLLKRSVRYHDSLFIKTYAHSLADSFIDKKKNIVFPLTHPSVVHSFKMLERLSAQNGIELKYITASEAYHALRDIDNGKAWAL